jgi:hypothetical protein
MAAKITARIGGAVVAVLATMQVVTPASLMKGLEKECQRDPSSENIPLRIPKVLRIRMIEVIILSVRDLGTAFEIEREAKRALLRRTTTLETESGRAFFPQRSRVEARGYFVDAVCILH